MSVSKVIWSSPNINKSHKLHNAVYLNDISIQSLKYQIVFFLLIVSEISLNLLLRVFGGSHSSIFMYMLICKTLLLVNLVFMVCYTYQIMQARFTMFVECRDDKSESILMSLVFDLLPQGRYYYEKLVKSRWLSQWLQKEAIEQEKVLAKQEEERRKMLFKIYLPSSHFEYNNVYEYPANREAQLHSESWRHSLYQDPVYTSTPWKTVSHMTSDAFNRIMEGVATSTPYLKTRVSPNLGGDARQDVPPPMAHMQDGRVSLSPDPRGDSVSHSSGEMVMRYQPSSPSHPRMNIQSSVSIFPSNVNRGGALSVVPSSEVWRRLNIESKYLNQWMLNLKQWLHGTIINRVEQEIKKLNEQCSQMGIADVVIGESNIQTLRQLANQPGNSFSTLHILINFLDCSKDQGYVVNRIKELSHGGSLGKFRWESGSSCLRHQWKEHLPNDSMLLLHLLSAYVDSRVHTNLHGMRTFSQQFIIDNIDNKDLDSLKDICILLQANVQPPHFKVIFNQTIFDITAGRNNLFECLLVFFHKVYKNEGNLKWLNLGRSGLNMNWIFERSD